MRDLDLLSLRAVLVLSEALNFRLAAAELNMTQPALSVRLQRLEDVIGVSLFERSRSSVALSPAGVELLPVIRKVVNDAKGLHQTAKRIAKGESGRLRIGYTPISFMTSVPRWIRSFSTTYPRIQFEMTELLSGQVEAHLVNRTIDLGFLHPPLTQSGLQTQELPASRYVVVVPEDDPLSGAERLPLSALSDRDFILTAQTVGPALFARILALCDAAGFVPKIRQEVPTSIAALGLVAAGHGISLLADACASVARSDVRFIEIEGEAPELPMSLAWFEDNGSAALDRFIEHVHVNSIEQVI